MELTHLRSYATYWPLNIDLKLFLVEINTIILIVFLHKSSVPIHIYNLFQEILHTHNKYEAVPIVLLGNKADLEDRREVTTKEGMQVRGEYRMGGM